MKCNLCNNVQIRDDEAHMGLSSKRVRILGEGEFLDTDGNFAAYPQTT